MDTYTSLAICNWINTIIIIGFSSYLILNNFITKNNQKYNTAIIIDNNDELKNKLNKIKCYIGNLELIINEINEIIDMSDDDESDEDYEGDECDDCKEGDEGVEGDEGIEGDEGDEGDEGYKSTESGKGSEITKVDETAKNIEGSEGDKYDDEWDVNVNNESEEKTDSK